MLLILQQKNKTFNNNFQPSTTRLSQILMKKYYEVALKTYANTPTAIDDFDLETIMFDDNSDNYRQCVKIAKKHSMHIGERCLANNTKVLAQVTVICYIMDDTSDYEVQWQEEYVNGIKTRRY